MRMTDERRRFPRIPVAWPVRLWLDEDAIIGRAEDASEHGICVAVAPTAAVKLGRSYRVDILGHDTDVLSVVGTVRYAAEQRVGFEIDRRVPLAEDGWPSLWNSEAGA